MRLQRLHVMCWHYWYIVACTRHREGQSTHPACVGRTGACVHEGTLCTLYVQPHCCELLKHPTYLRLHVLYGLGNHHAVLS